MRRLFKYVEWAEELYENVISSDELDRIDSYFDDMNDIEKFRADIKIELNIIKQELKSITFNDISILKTKKAQYIEKPNTIRIKLGFTEEIDSKIDLIKKLCSKFPEGEVKDEIVEDVDDAINELKKPGIAVEKDNFNQIHISGLPDIFRQLGLGYKIYKAVMRNMGYISSDAAEVQPSIFAKMIWDKLRQDIDCYTIVKEERVLCFFNTCKYNLITKILKEFIGDYTGENSIIDKDLIAKYPNILNDI